jgi:hypothetical protein
MHSTRRPVTPQEQRSLELPLGSLTPHSLAAELRVERTRCTCIAFQ